MVSEFSLRINQTTKLYLLKMGGTVTQLHTYKIKVLIKLLKQRKNIILTQLYHKLKKLSVCQLKNLKDS